MGWIHSMKSRRSDSLRASSYGSAGMPGALCKTTMRGVSLCFHQKLALPNFPCLFQEAGGMLIDNGTVDPRNQFSIVPTSSVA